MRIFILRWVLLPLSNPVLCCQSPGWLQIPGSDEQRVHNIADGSISKCVQVTFLSSFVTSSAGPDILIASNCSVKNFTDERLNFLFRKFCSPSSMSPSILRKANTTTGAVSLIQLSWEKSHECCCWLQKVKMNEPCLKLRHLLFFKRLSLKEWSHLSHNTDKREKFFM